MAILAECPICHRKQAVKNRVCKGCREDLVKPKKAMKVRYWIDYKVPNGKAIREPVGFSIEEARAADGKLKAQRIENPKILQKLPERTMTFRQLCDWYESQPMAKAKKYFDSLVIYLIKFNEVFGDRVVVSISKIDIDNYKIAMKDKLFSDAYIDHHIGAAKTVVYAAFDGKLVSADTVQTFKSVKKLLKQGSNARKRVLSVDEFDNLINVLPKHIVAILATAFYTGMRKGEILRLTWWKVDFENREIRLGKMDTKDRKARTIYINDELIAILAALPRVSDFVFTYRGKPVGDIREGLSRGCQRVGITYGMFRDNGFVFHDLRHTFVTMMRKASVATSVRMRITGHSTIEMDERYDTVDREDMILAFANHESFLRESRSRNRKAMERI